MGLSLLFMKLENKMQDERGYYYHAQAGNPKVRVYVRQGENGIEFRLWAYGHPEIWDQHEWLEYDVIRMAAEMYQMERNADADPLKLYDINIARNLLASEPD